MTETGPTAATVEGWLRDVENQVQALEQKIEPLLQEQVRLQERRSILRDLLASFDEREDGAPVLALTHRSTGRAETVRERVHREVVDILRETGRPMHINELTEAYIARGLKVPGQGKPANISVHLSGWPDISSPERGIYSMTSAVSDGAANVTEIGRNMRGGQ